MPYVPSPLAEALRDGTIDNPRQSPVAPLASTHCLNVCTDLPEATYHANEEVRFCIRLERDGKPMEGNSIAWEITKDGIPLGQRGEVILKNGEGVVVGKLDEPGFLRCEVKWACEGQTLSATAAAAIDPLEIRPSLPVPEDFDAFWREKKATLAGIPVNARLTPIPSVPDGEIFFSPQDSLFGPSWDWVSVSQPALEIFDVQADCVGAPVSGYYARPANAKPGSLPAALTFHGSGVSGAWFTNVVGWGKRNMLVMDINAHGIPNGQSPAFYQSLSRGELDGYHFKGRESRDTHYYLGMYLRIVRAIDFLTSQPEWDGRTLIVDGASQGGAQSLAAAALDSRVSFFAAGVPSACDHTGMMARRCSGAPRLVPINAEGNPDPAILEASRYFDSVNFASRIRVPGILTVGFVDSVCPPTGIYAAYNNLDSEKSIVDDVTAGHTLSPRMVKAIRDAILGHIRGGRS